jgi:cell division protein FtsB
MKEFKRIILRIALGVEISIFALYYLFASQGILTIMSLGAEIKKIEQEIFELNQEVLGLEHQIVLQKTCPFYKEKIAREQLQMARVDEEIYIFE